LIRKYLTILLLMALFTPVFGLATEKYYIDQQPVLLYKIIIHCLVGVIITSLSRLFLPVEALPYKKGDMRCIPPVPGI